MSLEIEKKSTTPTVLALSGRLDTATAPSFETEVFAILPTVDSLILDMSRLDYISSAGLRVILKVQKTLADKDGAVFKLTNVPKTVKEVFDITGFSDFLNIE